MKFEFDIKDIERSTDFEEAAFGIGDVAMVMGILRGKLYPNPIKAFTQEVMSNARDAHREVGKEDVPIEVQLPTALDRNFYVRDFGPGISPERMLDVFIMYGNSTKRKDNKETGGFGIGAKSPWSYTDQFGIVSITPNDDGKMIRRQYIAYIDETRVGRLAKMPDEKETDEPQGTTIVVGCKPGDENTFRDWVKTATQFWPVRPVIKGVKDFEWETVEKTFEGTNWFINITGITGRYSYGKKAPKAIVDGIPYPLNWDNLEIAKLPEKAQDVCNKLFAHSVYLEFETGEVALTANREEVDYNPRSIIIIQKKLIALANELKDQIAKGIKNATNLWDANLMWNKTENSLRSLVGESVWNGHKVTGRSPSIVEKSGITLYHYQRQWGGADFRKKSIYSSTPDFHITEKTMFFVNDESNALPNRRRLVTVFGKFKDIDDVFIYHTPAEGTLHTDGTDMRKKAKKALEDAEIDLYKPSKMTDYDKAPIVRKSKTGAGGTTTGSSVPRIWLFDESGDNKRSAWESDAGFDYTTEKGYYVLLKNREATGSVDGKSWPIYALSQAVLSLKQGKLVEARIYGVSEQVKDKIGTDLIPLETGIQSIYDALKVDAAITKYTGLDLSDNDVASDHLNILWPSLKPKWKAEITDKNGSIFKYFESSELVEDASEKLALFNRVEQFVNGLRPTNYYDSTNYNRKAKLSQATKTAKYTDLKTLWKKVETTYPLLTYVNQWSYERRNHLQAVIDYTTW